MTSIDEEYCPGRRRDTGQYDPYQENTRGNYNGTRDDRSEHSYRRDPDQREAYSSSRSYRNDGWQANYEQSRDAHNQYDRQYNYDQREPVGRSASSGWNYADQRSRDYSRNNGQNQYQNSYDPTRRDSHDYHSGSRGNGTGQHGPPQDYRNGYSERYRDDREYYRGRNNYDQRDYQDAPSNRRNNVIDDRYFGNYDRHDNRREYRDEQYNRRGYNDGDGYNEYQSEENRRRSGFYASQEYERARAFERQMEMEYYTRINRNNFRNSPDMDSEHRPHPVTADGDSEYRPPSLGDIASGPRRSYDSQESTEKLDFDEYQRSFEENPEGFFERHDYSDDPAYRTWFVHQRAKALVQGLIDTEEAERLRLRPGSEEPPQQTEARESSEEMETSSKLNVSPETSRNARMRELSVDAHLSPSRSSLSVTPTSTPSPTPSTSNQTVTYQPAREESPQFPRQKNAGGEVNNNKDVESLTTAMRSNIISDPPNKGPSWSNGYQQQKEPTCSKYAVPQEKLISTASIPMANRSDKEMVTLCTNMFPLVVKRKTVYLYDVAVKVVAADGRSIRISKNEREKVQGRSQRDEACVAAMRAALEMYGMIRSGEASIYDGGAKLYCSEGLLAVLKPHSNVLQVSVSSLPANIVSIIDMPHAENVVIEFGRENQFNLLDYKETASNKDAHNKSKPYQQFFDVLTSEPALASGKFTAFCNGNLFAKDARGTYVGNGQETFEGIKKGIAFISPKKLGMVPALVLDSFVGHFFVSQNAVKTVCDMLGVDWRRENMLFPFGNEIFFRINAKVRGIRFTINTDKNKKTTFVATGLSKSSIDCLHETDVTGRSHPVLKAARFADADITRVRKHWPAVELRVKVGERTNTMYYPLEFLTVAKHQTVPIERIDNVPVKIRRVQERFEAISGMVNALNLQSSSPYSQITQAFGVSVSSKPLKVEAIKRALPGVSFKGGVVMPDKKNADFHMQAYSQPASIGDIIVCHDCSADIVKQMADRLDGEARALGMKINRWHYLDVTKCQSIIEKIFTAFSQVDQAKQMGDIGENPVIFYVDDGAVKSHQFLKYFERKYLIISQHLTTEIAEKLVHGKTSRINVLNKLNCKVGGCNYSVVPDKYSKHEWITNGKSLIIGYDVAHPTGHGRGEMINATSVIGFSYNGIENPESFVGDYHYQLPRHEMVDDHVLIGRMQWMLAGFLKHRQLPENIFIIRDGVSEGQYNMVFNREFRAIKQGVEEFKKSNAGKISGIESWQPKYALVVVCKRHNKRFAVEAKDGIFSNALPGTVVDDEAVRKDMTHFYLLPHKAYQGTAKLPSYHILLYELDQKNQDQLQSMLLALSFNHQISQNSTSLPEPVYQADEWAKRGHENFKVFKELEELPRVSKWNPTVHDSAPIDYERLTGILCYRGTLLESFRLNA